MRDESGRCRWVWTNITFVLFLLTTISGCATVIRTATWGVNPVPATLVVDLNEGCRLAVGDNLYRSLGEPIFSTRQSGHRLDRKQSAVEQFDTIVVGCHFKSNLTLDRVDVSGWIQLDQLKEDDAPYRKGVPVS